LFVEQLVSLLLLQSFPRFLRRRDTPLKSLLHRSFIRFTTTTMPSVKLTHHSPPDTIASDSVRLLSRETLRISASLASPPVDDLPPHSPPPPDSQFLHSTLRLICCEEIDGRRFKYVAESDGSGRFKKNSVRAISLESPQTPFDVCLVPLMNSFFEFS